MSYDLVVRGGTVIDGSGLPRVRADVGVVDGRIVEVGRIRDRGRREIDADGRVVTPGFVDGHTHMDAQVFWDPYGTSSCWHGVTTVVMGNCGFTLAPARADARELVVRNLERAEDMSPAALAAGITWSWEDYPGYLDAIDRLPKAINYAGYVGHSALRTWAMGERAFEEDANEEDLKVMRQQLHAALDAGAMGFTTSRAENHQTSDDRPVASRVAAWEEVAHLVRSMGERHPDRIFELAVDTGASSPDPEVRRAVLDPIGALAADAGVPVTFGVVSTGGEGQWRDLLGLIDHTNETGGRMFGQSLPREATIVLSFKSRLPFDKLKAWADIRVLPLDEQRRALEDPEERRRLVDAAKNGPYVDAAIGAIVRPPDWERIRVIQDAAGLNPTVAEIARARGVDPVDAFIDLSLESDFGQFFSQCVGNPDQDDVLAMLRHPRVIPTFSDSGAHVGYVMESSIQSFLLAYWVRRREAFTLEEAIRMLTLAPATAWGFADRGLIRRGFVADLNVIDPDTVGPAPLEVVHDLPSGAMRLIQRSVGISSTIVAGEEVLADGEHTGALPGRLLRK